MCRSGKGTVNPMLTLRSYRAATNLRVILLGASLTMGAAGTRGQDPGAAAAAQAAQQASMQATQQAIQMQQQAVQQALS